MLITFESQILGRQIIQSRGIQLNRFLRTNAALTFIAGGSLGAAFAFANFNTSSSVLVSLIFLCKP